MLRTELNSFITVSGVFFSKSYLDMWEFWMGGGYCLMNHRQLSPSQVFQSKENNIPLCYKSCVMNPNVFASG